jgi:hypothetical protein
MMVGATDLQKAQMQIRWLKRDIREICSKAWWTSKRLMESEGVPQYFVKHYGVTEEAINEAYFLGRQAGRLDLAKSIIDRIGPEEDE